MKPFKAGSKASSSQKGGGKAGGKPAGNKPGNKPYAPMKPTGAVSGKGSATVVMNSFVLEMTDRVSVKVLRVEFSPAKFPDKKGRDEDYAIKMRALDEHFGGLPFTFDGGSMVVTVDRAAPVSDAADGITFTVEREESMAEIRSADEPLSEQVIALAVRRPEDISVGRRLFGGLAGPARMDGFRQHTFDWLRCQIVSPILSTLVIDIRHELITINREVSVLDYLRDCSVELKSLPDIMRELQGLKLRVRLGADKVRDVNSIKAVLDEREAGFPVREHLAKTYGARSNSSVMVCVRKAGEGPCPLYYPLDCLFLRPRQRVTADRFREEVLHQNCSSPHDRLASILEAVKRVNDAELFRGVGCKVLAQPLSVEAKVLPSPLLRGGKGPLLRDGKGAEAIGANWRPGYPLFDPAAKVSWVLVSYRRPKDDEAMAFFRESFVPVFGSLGMRLEPSGRLLGRQDMNTIKPASGNFIAFVLLSRRDQYDEAKLFLDSHAIVSQCMEAKPKKFFNNNRSYAQMVALKVNVKLRGANLALDASNRTLLAKKTLVLGFDVHHPPVGSAAPSMAALVGSLDTTYQRYGGSFEACKNRRELGTLSEAMLRPFASQKPERVLFFRDGVGKQSVEHVMDLELPQLTKLFPGVPITVVLVTKRHSHRLFTTSHGNVEAGTLILGDDRCLPKESFLLTSHTGVLGTSRCCKYMVLKNDPAASGWSTLDIARMAFELAHLHPRATKAVSMPVPLYQAHLLAYRARHYEGKSVKSAGMWWE